MPDILVECQLPLTIMSNRESRQFPCENAIKFSHVLPKFYLDFLFAFFYLRFATLQLNLIVFDTVFDTVTICICMILMVV